MKVRSIASPIVFCSLLVITGIVIGMLGLRVLTPDEKAELLSYLEVFMKGLFNPGLEPPVILRLSFMHNLKTILMIWAFGLAIVGAPLTCVMLFVRGFALGFSSAFVIGEIVPGGFWVFASGMLPHNLIALPALVLLSSMSLSFSIRLFKERPWVHGSLLRLGVNYTLRCALVAAFFLVSSFLEAFLTPYLLKTAALRF